MSWYAKTDSTQLNAAGTTVMKQYLTNLIKRRFLPFQMYSYVAH